ncbi:MAG: SpoIID/LytB domain-containing protein, partial [Clostridia bacterium]|nr:SpoIID/LytB domain-containing protein [Clostridia bacterium]
TAAEPLASALQTATVSSPSATAVTVIDGAANKILWKFDDATGATFMAAEAFQAGSVYSYIKGYKNDTKYTYDGVLEFSPSVTEDASGVRVINVLPLETYVAGVIPYEIGNSWPLETQKAFAIAVRSYAVSNLGRHKRAYNADLCSSTDCQVYKGFGSTNALVRQAVTETAGQVAVYNGTNEICITAYSSSTGGCTANAWDVWGSNPSSYGYLKAVATPWEKYEQYGKGSWTFTATGKQLYEQLKTKGYTGLKSYVTKVEITGVGENSTYVTAIKFYDGNGNSVEVKQGNKIKSLLSSYVNSGNFVVAKAGETVTQTNFVMSGFGAYAGEPAMGVVIKTNPYDYSLYGRQTFSVLTADGVKTFTDSNGVSVMTGGGVTSYDMSHALDATYYPTMIGVNGEAIPDIRKLKAASELETLTANGSDGTFVFIGRGWGHGVGLSQWGIKDLGDLGYDYETIFKAYYSDVRIVDYTAYRDGTA